MFVVTGATGKVGGGVAEKLLSAGKKVKVLGRNREKLSQFENKGAEIAVGDMADAVFLAKSFSGAEAVFLMIPSDFNSEDIHALYDTYGTAIAKAVAESGAKKFINLSSVGAELHKGNGPIAGLHRQEQRLNAIPNVDILHLRPAYFMENHFGSIGMIKGMGINGAAAKSDMAIPQIATKDIAEYAAMRMGKLDWTGKSVQELLGQRDISMHEVTQILGQAIGKPDLAYVQFPYEDALQGMMGAGISKSVAESYVDMYKGFNDGVIAKVPRTEKNTTPTAIEDFAQIFAYAYKA